MAITTRTVDQITADIQACRSELSNPNREVRMTDRGVTYRPPADVEKALALLEAELAAAQANVITRSRVRQIRLFSTGGFNNGRFRG